MNYQPAITLSFDTHTPYLALPDGSTASGDGFYAEHPLREDPVRATGSSESKQGTEPQCPDWPYSAPLSSPPWDTVGIESGERKHRAGTGRRCQLVRDGHNSDRERSLNIVSWRFDRRGRPRRRGDDERARPLDVAWQRCGWQSTRVAVIRILSILSGVKQ